MQKSKLLWAALAVASSLFAISAPANAQATRTWVSGVGSDADPCSRTAPCKTFAGAISKTATNGIINCLDPAGYGGVTITKSITIDCHEVLGSILVGDSGTGIIINIATGDPKDPLRTVRLRNIDVAGIGIGTTGVSILSAAAVIMEDLSVTGFNKTGISDTRTEGGTMLTVKNSIVANNSGPGILAAAASTSNVVLDNVHSVKNTYGVAAAKGNNVTVNRSVFSSNSLGGVEADASSVVAVDNSVISHNLGPGVSGAANAVVLSNNDIMFNTVGISVATTSFGTNRLFGNSMGGVAPTPAGATAPAEGQQ